MKIPIAKTRVLLRRLWLTAMALSFFAAFSISQISDRIARVITGSWRPGAPMTIQIELVNASIMERVEIGYRQFGQRDFKRAEMVLNGNTASILIPPSSLTPPFLEYYFILTLRGAAVPETYPIENPEQQPLQLLLQENADKTGIIILSPEPNERVNADEVLISFSLIRTDTSVDRSATKIFLDGADVSAAQVRNDELIALKPENASMTLSGGVHTVRVDLVTRSGQPYGSADWTFVVRPTAAEATTGETPVSEWKYRASMQLESRHEDISSLSTPYNRATLSGKASYGILKLNGKLYATNEEDPKRQPQDRFFFGAEIPWVKLGYGDSYPEMPDMIMNGKRVRGLSGGLMLGGFTLDVVKGDIIRRIESDTLMTFSADSLGAEQRRDSSAAFGLYDPLSNPQRWAKFSYGTYRRDLLVIRPAFVKEDSHFGFTYLKSTDELGSIRFGIRPQENLVFGSDLVLSFDRRKLEFSGQVAASVTNKDYRNGTLNDAQIDSIFKEPDYSSSDRDDIRHFRDGLERFITVNENTVPLSLKNRSTLSYETALAMNYFDNSFRFTYLRHGVSFQSFGQSFFRNDVAGFNIADRVHLAENQLLLSASFERLRDNTAETKPATTTSTTVSTGITYFPRNQFPGITVGYLYALNENPIALDSVNAVSDQTNRGFLQLSKSFVWGIQHNASLNVSISHRDDRTIRNLDTRNLGVGFSNTSQFAIPLRTTISAMLNRSEFVASDSGQGTLRTQTYRYTTIYFGAEYRVAHDRVRLSGTVSPTLGDLERTLYNAGVQYTIERNLALVGEFSYYHNLKTTNDIIWSLILRYDV